MPTINSSDLVTINLKYGSTATPRKILAFSQLCAKVLFASDKPLGVKQLRHEIGKLLGVGRLSESPVVQGLKFLVAQNKAKQTGTTWLLTPSSRSEIAEHIKQSHSTITGVLERHFPNDIDRVVLTAWFNEAAASVFGRFGDEWVTSVCKGSRPFTSRLQTLPKLLSQATSHHGLNSRKESLRAGFLGFLKSDDPADHRALMGLGQAMFQARLVAADIGVDPFTLEEFRGATILFDTNLIFAVVMEGHRLAKSIRALSRALKDIGVKATYIRPTRDEYERTIHGISRNVLPLIEVFPLELIEESHSDVVSTAVARGCKTVEDYERFFSQVNDLPKEVGPGLPLTLFENKEVAASILKGEKDTGLKLRIKSLATQLRQIWRRKEKSELSLNHDSALIHVTEDERTIGNKCWVVSLDRSVQGSSIERAGPHSLPTVLSADALIEILAADGVGPNVDPTDFAPLLAHIIVNECAPPPSTFTIDDLNWMYSINQGVAELPLEDARDIVTAVYKARVQGAKIDDTKLRLDIDRMYQAKRKEVEARLADAQERVRSAEQREHDTQLEFEAARRQLIEHKTADFKRAALVKLGRQLMWRVTTTIGIGIVIWFILSVLTKGMTSIETWRYIVPIALSLAGLIKFSWQPWKEYRAENKAANERARNSVYNPSPN